MYSYPFLSFQKFILYALFRGYKRSKMLIFLKGRKNSKQAWKRKMFYYTYDIE